LILFLAKQDRESRALPHDDVDKSLTSVHESSFDVSGNTEDEVANSSGSKARGKKRKQAKLKKSKQSKHRCTKEDEESTDSGSDSSGSSDSDEEDQEDQVKTIFIGSKKVRQLPFQAAPKKMQSKARPRPRPLNRSKAGNVSASNTMDPAHRDEPTTADDISANGTAAPSISADGGIIADIPMAAPEDFTPSIANSTHRSQVNSFADVTTAPPPQIDSFDITATDSFPQNGSTVGPSPPDDYNAGAIISPSSQDDPPSDATITSLDGIDGSMWPAWFRNGFVPLREAKLGQKWESILSKYVAIEARAEFISPKGATHAFSSDKRPAKVEWWIARARKPKPVIKGIAKFTDSFWAWWKGLQPKWRGVDSVDGPLTIAHRHFQSPGEGGWMVLNKPGQNGFLTVISLLSWWGQALQDENIGMAGWEAAVEDVDWVLMRMLSDGGQE